MEQTDALAGAANNLPRRIQAGMANNSARKRHSIAGLKNSMTKQCQ